MCEFMEAVSFAFKVLDSNRKFIFGVNGVLKDRFSMFDVYMSEYEALADMNNLVRGVSCKIPVYRFNSFICKLLLANRNKVLDFDEVDEGIIIVTSIRDLQTVRDGIENNNKLYVLLISGRCSSVSEYVLSEYKEKFIGNPLFLDIRLLNDIPTYTGSFKTLKATYHVSDYGDRFIDTENKVSFNDVLCSKSKYINYNKSLRALVMLLSGVTDITDYQFVNYCFHLDTLSTYLFGWVGGYIFRNKDITLKSLELLYNYGNEAMTLYDITGLKLEFILRNRIEPEMFRYCFKSLDRFLFYAKVLKYTSRSTKYWGERILKESYRVRRKTFKKKYTMYNHGDFHVIFDKDDIKLQGRLHEIPVEYIDGGYIILWRNDTTDWSILKEYSYCFVKIKDDKVEVLKRTDSGESWLCNTVIISKDMTAVRRRILFD